MHILFWGNGEVGPFGELETASRERQTDGDFYVLTFLPSVGASNLKLD